MDHLSRWSHLLMSVFSGLGGKVSAMSELVLLLQRGHDTYHANPARRIHAMDEIKRHGVLHNHSGGCRPYRPGLFRSMTKYGSTLLVG